MRLAWWLLLRRENNQPCTLMVDCCCRNWLNRQAKFTSASEIVVSIAHIWWLYWAIILLAHMRWLLARRRINSQLRRIDRTSRTKAPAAWEFPVRIQNATGPLIMRKGCRSPLMPYRLCHITKGPFEMRNTTCICDEVVKGRHNSTTQDSRISAHQVLERGA